jgi:hypothetical protein
LAEGRLLSLSACVRHRQLDEVRGSHEVLGCHGVTDRLGAFTVLLEPFRCAPMQVGD